MPHSIVRPVALLPLLVMAALAAAPRVASAAPEKAPAAPAPASPQPTAEAVAREQALAAEQAQHVADCKAHALTRLKAQSPSIDDIFIDMDGLTIAKGDLKVGNTPIDTVIMGEAYIQRDRSDKVHRFLCLTGAEGEVLMTFFTEQ